MKFLRSKILKGREYYYFEYPVRVFGAKRWIFSRYLGVQIPQNFPEIMQKIFQEIAVLTQKKIPPAEKNYFQPKSLLPIEQARFWFQGLHHEFYENDLKLFRFLFAVLFILNSNRAEGSRVTRQDIEKFIKRKRKPKTLLDLEIMNSFAALRFAFSKRMKWDMKSIKILHQLLFQNIVPEIAGKFKKINVVIHNEMTTDWKKVKKELHELIKWFLANKKKYYPPILALEFHYRFEAIHPFEDGNGRVGRLLCNAFLLQKGYMPIIFFNENHARYTAALSSARQGRKKKLAHYFLQQVIKTQKAVPQYRKEGIMKGGSLEVGRWEVVPHGLTPVAP